MTVLHAAQVLRQSFGRGRRVSERVNDSGCSSAGRRKLPRRVFWRSGAPPFFIRQTMTKANMWQASTGSAVWGGGIVLSRYMEVLGSTFWEGKRVLELGTGTGLGSVTAPKLGAARVLAIDPAAASLTRNFCAVYLEMGAQRLGTPAEKGEVGLGDGCAKRRCNIQ